MLRGMLCKPFELHARCVLQRVSDTDACFGSKGSFSTLSLMEGCFEANPPFDEAVVSRMLQHMEALLKGRRAKDIALLHSNCSFVARSTCWRNLRDSQWRAKSITLAQESTGIARARNIASWGRYRVANSDSSVFFLQSREGVVATLFESDAASAKCVQAASSR